MSQNSSPKDGTLVDMGSTHMVEGSILAVGITTTVAIESRVAFALVVVYRTGGLAS